MIKSGYLTFHLAISVLVATAGAQIQPPEVKSIKPAVVLPGGSTDVVIEGKGLDRAGSIVFEDDRRGEFQATIRAAREDRFEAALRVPEGSAAGPVAFRVVSASGLSNLARFEVARVGPIVAEAEPNGGFRAPQVVPSPSTVDGRIQEGNEVDVFAIDVQAGETIVAEVFASRGGSMLDSILTLYSPDRRELASADDVFGRDAAVSAKARVSGRHYLQIADANGKDRDGKTEGSLQGNRVYRLSIGVLPLLLTADPPGVRRGESTRIRLLGANIPPESTIAPPADAPTGDFSFRVAGSNPIPIRVGAFSEHAGAEPDDRVDQATEVLVPASINGRFDRKTGGDLDHYRVRPRDGIAGSYAITCLAARLGSPADPVLAILGDDARPVAEDDDKLGRDARIERTIGPEGILLAARDYYGRGGDRFVYRIEVEPASILRFSLDPGARTVPRRGRIAVPIEVDRKGFAGPIAIDPGSLPEGLSGSTVVISPGSNRGLFLLSATETAPIAAFRLTPRVVEPRGPVDWSTIGSKTPDPVRPDWTFATAEAAPIDLKVEPAGGKATIGGEIEWKVTLDRRGEAAKGLIKVSIRVAEGEPSGIDLPAEQSCEPGVIEKVLRLKIKPDAARGIRKIVASARFEGVPPGREVASNPTTLEVVPKGD